MIDWKRLRVARAQYRLLGALIKAVEAQTALLDDIPKEHPDYHKEYKELLHLTTQLYRLNQEEKWQPLRAALFGRYVETRQKDD